MVVIYIHESRSFVKHSILVTTWFRSCFYIQIVCYYLLFSRLESDEEYFAIQFNAYLFSSSTFICATLGRGIWYENNYCNGIDFDWILYSWSVFRLTRSFKCVFLANYFPPGVKFFIMSSKMISMQFSRHLEKHFNDLICWLYHGVPDLSVTLCDC